VLDYHVHSDYSPDGKASIAQQCQAALRAGFREICFTEHLEYGAPVPEFAAQPRFEQWFEEIARQRAAFPALRILAGVEAADLESTTLDTMREVRRWPFDYVLLSQHIVDGVDPYDQRFYEGRGQSDAYMAYARAVLDSLKRFEPNDYDALAHYGYVAKFAPYDMESRAFTRDFAPEIIDESLRILARHGKALEINTSRMAMGMPIPGPALIRRFRELGGEMVTLGSDAHRSDMVGAMLREGARLALDSGVKYLARYEARRLTPISIEEVLG